MGQHGIDYSYDHLTVASTTPSKQWHTHGSAQLTVAVYYFQGQLNFKSRSGGATD